MRILLALSILCAIPQLAAAQVCGDGVLDPGEQCDDGNTIAGDTCTSCQCGCGTITADTNLTCDITANSGGDCVVLGAPNITLDCDGHSITGNNSGRGVTVSGHDGVIVRECSIRDFTWGIRMEGASNSRVSANRLTENTVAISVSSPASAALDGVRVLRNFVEIPSDVFGSGIDLSAELGAENQVGWNVVRVAGFFSPGISVSGAAAVRVEHNTVTAALQEGVGIALWSAGGKVVDSNTVAGLISGIELTDSVANQISRNAIDGNTSGIVFSNELTQHNVLRKNLITKKPSQLGLDFNCFTADCYANDIDTSNSINALPIHHYDGVYLPCPIELGALKAGRVDLVSCPNAVVKGIAMDNGDGIHLIYPYGGRVARSSVARSPFGVASYYGSGAAIDHNTFQDMNGPSIFLECAIDFSVADNAIDGGPATGIWGLHILDTEVLRNEIKNLGPFVFGTELGGALQLTAGSSRNLVADNRIFDNDAYGIFFVGAWFFEATTDNLVTGNVVQNNAVDLKMCGHSIDGTDRLSNNTISYNLFTPGDPYPMEICNVPVCDNNTTVGNVANGVLFVDEGDGCSG